MAYTYATPVRCKAFGCVLHEHAPECARCGAYLYDADFTQSGWLDPLFRAWGWLCGLPYRLVRRCDVCGRRMWRPKDYCCSEECYDKWIPF